MEFNINIKQEINKIVKRKSFENKNYKEVWNWTFQRFFNNHGKFNWIKDFYKSKNKIDFLNNKNPSYLLEIKQILEN